MRVERRALLREIGVALLAAIVFGPLLLIVPAFQAYGSWVLAAAPVGAVCSGVLHVMTRSWPARWPAFAPWREAFVAAAAVQSVGVGATLLSFAPVAGLKLGAAECGRSA